MHPIHPIRLICCLSLLISSVLTPYFLSRALMNGLTTCDLQRSSSLTSIPTDSDSWDVTELPIQKSVWNGFRPIYVYSMVPPDTSKDHYSQSKQDLLIIKLLETLNAKSKNSTAHRPAPFFIDLAANDALELSNTYLLERKGWSGVCIEPNPMYWYRLAAYRTCAIVGAFVGVPEAEDGKEASVILSNGVYGGIVAEGMDNAKRESEEKRNLVSINTIFKQTNVPRVIDYLSLDVEGAEYLVMQDFPFDTYMFRFLTIERAKKPLRGLLMGKGYKLVRMITNFGESVWMHESVNLSEGEFDEVCKALNIQSYSHDPKDWLLPRGVLVNDFL